MDWRVEHDLLGEKGVPKDAYYGIHTLRASENFITSGSRVHPRLIKAVAYVKEAAAKANMALNKLPEDSGKAIIKACNEIRTGQYADQFILYGIQGGAGTSINMNVNEVIANRAIELLGGRKGDYNLVHPLNHVNMAQSTNDVIPTAVRIALLQSAKELQLNVTNLEKAFSKKARQFHHVVKMGRTHLQDAIPIRLGQEMEAYGAVAGNDRKRIKSAVSVLHEINIGATAVGTSLNAEPRYIEIVTKELSMLTGLPLKKAKNLVCATQNTDGYLQYSAALKSFAVNLSKIANDLRLMASGPQAGFSEIFLPPVQAGSSIMPAKVNPVIPEMVNQVAFQIQGNDMTVTLACGAGQLELNVMQPVLALNLIQSTEMLAETAKIFTEKCVLGIKANEKRCRLMVEESVGLVTALSPVIGYEKASSVAKEALVSGKTIKEVVLSRKLLSKEQCEFLLSEEHLVNAK